MALVSLWHLAASVAGAESVMPTDAQAKFNAQKQARSQRRRQSTEHALAGRNFAAFLSHDWGTDENGRSNHNRVTRIKKALDAKGVDCWYDEEQMEGDIQAQMCDGIDDSTTVVVFVTKSAKLAHAQAGEMGAVIT